MKQSRVDIVRVHPVWIFSPKVMGFLGAVLLQEPANKGSYWSLLGYPYVKETTRGKGKNWAILENSDDYFCASETLLRHFWGRAYACLKRPNLKAPWACSTSKAMCLADEARAFMKLNWTRYINQQERTTPHKKAKNPIYFIGSCPFHFLNCCRFH